MMDATPKRKPSRQAPTCAIEQWPTCSRQGHDACCEAHLFCVTTSVSVTVETVSALALKMLQGPSLPSALMPATLQQGARMGV